MGLSLPLPDGRTWTIDDHSRDELVAVHRPTQSTVTVAILRAAANVGRVQCEEAARARHLVPTQELITVEDQVASVQNAFDTRIRVGLEPGLGPDRPVVGHVVAVGGFLRKCFVFDYATRVENASQEPALSSRLAFARTRIFGGLTIDLLGVVPGVTPESAASP